MNTPHRQLVALKATKTLAAWASPEACRFLSVGDEYGWAPAVLGRAPLPAAPVRLKDWLLVPVEQDTSPIPTRALKRVQTLYEAGLRPKGFVMVHEAPALLAAPARTLEQSTRHFDVTDSERKSALLAAGGGAAAAVATAGALALVVASVVAVAAFALPLFAVAGAVAVDPILVAVTDDDYWIEIDRWATPT